MVESTLRDALDTIAAHMGTAVRDMGWLTGITDTGSMIDGGARFQNFRRSDDIEDRRNQKLSPQGYTDVVAQQGLRATDTWAQMSGLTDELFSSSSSLSKSLGIDNLPISR